MPECLGDGLQKESSTCHVSKNFSFTSTVGKRKHDLCGVIFFHFILVPGIITSFSFRSSKGCHQSNMVVETYRPSLTPPCSPSVPRTPFSWRQAHSGWVSGAKSTFMSSPRVVMERICNIITSVLVRAKSFIIRHCRKRAISPSRKERQSFSGRRGRGNSQDCLALLLHFVVAMLPWMGGEQNCLRSKRGEQLMSPDCAKNTPGNTHTQNSAKINQSYLLAFICSLQEAFHISVVLFPLKQPHGTRFHLLKFSGKAKGRDILATILVNFKGSP